MIATAVALLTIAVIGLPIAAMLDPSSRGGLLAGSAFLLGAGWMAFVLLFLSLVEIHWSVVPVVAVGVLPVILWLVGVRSRREVPVHARAVLAPASNAQRTLALAATVLTVLVIAGYFVFATMAPLGQWDFWAMWGLKGKVFFESGGIDWSFLHRPENHFVNPDYPILVPLLFDFLALAGGRWDDRTIGMLFPVVAIAFLLIARWLLAEELRSRLAAALGTLALSGFACTQWVGLAEGPLVAYVGAGFLFVRHGDRTGNLAMVRTGAVMLGLAAFTKNEGIAAIVAVALALAVTSKERWSRLRALWPAVLLAAPWPILRHLFDLPSQYLGKGSAFSLLLSRVAHPHELITGFASGPPAHPLFALLLAVILLSNLRTALRRERFLLLAVALQFGSYFAVYLTTSLSPVWQISFSWERLFVQMAIPLMFLGVVLASRMAGIVPDGGSPLPLSPEMTGEAERRPATGERGQG